MSVLSLIHETTLENLLLKKETVLRKNHVNRESKTLDLTIKLYRSYEHKYPSSCNTTIYLSWLLHLEGVPGVKVHTSKHKKWWPWKCYYTQVDQGW